ncbi:MAG: hypothetical protein FWG17_07850, partial [Desulfovibrionaceae bacterium]|nr:hypothetical protein [Desulfovibrionaceae bacterium]
MAGVTLNTFIQTAQDVQGDVSLKVSDGNIKTQGRVGDFFTFSSTHRATIDSFVQSLRAEYGDQAGRMAGTMLQGARDAGKPLSARMVQQLVGLARQEALDGFLNDAPALQGPPPRHLTQAVDQFLTAKGLPPDQSGLVRQHALEVLKSGRGEFNTLDGLFSQVAQGLLPGLDTLAGMIEEGPGHFL